MSERERLIELLSDKVSNETTVKIIADYLLENGVIVPLVNVGDTEKFLDCEASEKALAERGKQPNCNNCSYVETTERGLYCCYFNGATQNENDWCYHYNEREENA